MGKQVMDIAVSKGMTGAQSNEHLRNRSEAAEKYAETKGNYDRTREGLNFEVLKGGVIAPVDKNRSIPQRIADNLRERGVKDPNEGLNEPKYRTVVNIILGGSRERMHELAFGDQKVNLDKGADNSSISRRPEIERWAADMRRFIADKYGEENIAAFVVHLDELNPHIHCTLLPIQDGKFAYKQIFAGKDKYEYSAKMKALHNELAEVNAKWGLSRGSSVMETGAGHRTSEEYRRGLTADCTNLEQQIAQAEKRVKGLGTMVANLERQFAEKEAALTELEKKGGDVTAERERLLKELDAVRTKLSEKKEKLSAAEEKLSSVRKEMDNASTSALEMRTEAREYTREVKSGVDNIVRDALLESVVSEHAERVADLYPSERELFDGSMLESVAERGNEVVHCATLLFLGMVIDATDFAETHGGGGGPGSGWGKDDDEDNKAWARRCVREAARMMQPPKVRRNKR